MKKIILSIVFFVAIIQKSNATQWMTSFEGAKKIIYCYQQINCN
ncbi:hypothetical protein [Tenacibaculum sp. L6]|nr:hypothetical protein [Tenacibaculum sp. L6]MDE0536392.1 hypothetical protein [Tenacibaculum sp. L6]